MKRIKGLNEQADYIAYLENIRFQEQEYCPHCGHFNVARKRENETIGRWNCYNCGSSFSVLSGTMFAGTRYPLEDYFEALRLMLISRSSLSSNEMADHLGVTQRAAYRIQSRIRQEFLREESFTKLSGVLEADETYMDIKIGKVAKAGRGADKLKVLGIVERRGKAVVRIVNDVSGATIRRFISESINPDSSVLITDNFKSYSRVNEIVPHHVITRKQSKFNGGVHTNTIEGFWLHLKRAFRGIHLHYSEDNAPLYLAEATYKYNRRYKNKYKVFHDFLVHSLRVSEMKIQGTRKPVIRNY